MLGVDFVEGAEESRQAGFHPRDYYRVNMIGHQAIGQYLDRRLGQKLGGEANVPAIVLLIDRRRLPSNPALSDVVWIAGNNKSPELGHVAAP